MPDAVAPGVYVEEAPAGARAIAGVPTSMAAFLGATQAGPVAAPLLVHSFAEFEAQFGGLAAEMPLGYAVQQYFANGGRDALIARIVPSGSTPPMPICRAPRWKRRSAAYGCSTMPSISTSSASRRLRAPPTSGAPPGMPPSPMPSAAAR
jgi:phage tail sheath protein FI